MAMPGAVPDLNAFGNYELSLVIDCE